MPEVYSHRGISPLNSLLKRTFDLVVSIVGLLALWWLILIAWIVASIDTHQNGFFVQERVGKNGELFKVIKIRTMRDNPAIRTTVTQAHDPRITRTGALLRRSRIDEIPQLINVLMGQMSVVGPRPDVAGFADRLQGRDRIVLTIRPGITGPATLRFRHEEALLAQASDPEEYNRDVIYPEKIRLNREYIEQYSFWKDISISSTR